MAGKLTFGNRTFDAVNILLMVAIMVVTVYPILYVLFASFSDPVRISENRGLLLYPLDFTLEPYKMALSNANIWTGFKNTMIYVVVGVVISMVCTSLGAYVLSRKGLMLAKPLMLTIVITMFFSGGLIPFFIIVRDLGMVNTLWAIVLPNAVSAWNLIVMRTFFQNIPEELIESAKIDGASELTIFIRIVLPLSLAAMAVIGLFYAVADWNAWFNASIFLRQREMYPLQLILREILVTGQNDAEYLDASMVHAMEMKRVLKYAFIILSTAPIVIVYPFLQKYFVKGVLIGSLKG